MNFGGDPFGTGAGGGFMPSTFGESPLGGKTVAKSGAERQFLLPVTIRQVHKGTQTQNDAPISIDGREVPHVAIVGLVRHIEETSTNITYKIDDGTGWIDVRKFIDSKDTAQQIADRQKITLNKYVYVIGNIRNVAGARFINMFHIHPIPDSNEITFHFLEAIRAHLYNKRGPTPQQGAAAHTSHQTGITTANMTGGGGYGFPTSGADVPGLNVCQNEVIAVLRSNNALDSGTSFAMLRQSFLGKYTDHDIRMAVDFLVQEGHLYTTIDEEHFKYCEPS